jgi:prolyl-tRNA synthetase
LNTNLGRDYQADIVADIAEARAGDACPICGAALRASRGVEVGNIFKLGTFYSDRLGCTYLDRDGQAKPVIMGSYGIGVGRLLACVAELHHDEKGLRWPIAVAPYPVHLVALTGESGAALALATRLEAELAAAGVESLFDDREESPGVKFNDADLIGLPLRLTVSERSLKRGGVELKRRDGAESLIVPPEEIVAHVRAEIEAMTAELAARVMPEPFTE